LKSILTRRNGGSEGHEEEIEDAAVILFLRVP
jgi:hypothetical protein